MRVIRAEAYLADWEARMAAKTGGRAAELSDEELADCVDEAARRGLAVDRGEVAEAYEYLVIGQVARAAERLSRALFPGGADTILACAEAAIRDNERPK